MNVGDTITPFCLPVTGDDKPFDLSHTDHRFVVLYFYPKDDTPGCTIEGNCFSSLTSDFTACDATVLGISRDSIAAHDKFRSKYHYVHHLLSDSSATVCEQLGVLKEKSLFGKRFMGIERSTFIIDTHHYTIVAKWQPVSGVKDHAHKVLNTLQQLVRDLA